MKYIRWTIGKEITGRFPNRRLVDLITEVDDSGRVSREVGIDDGGDVVHRAPSPDDPYGLFDNQVIEPVDRENDIAPDAFERLWRSGSA
jgi:hypothetical protein